MVREIPLTKTWLILGSIGLMAVVFSVTYAYPRFRTGGLAIIQQDIRSAADLRATETASKAAELIRRGDFEGAEKLVQQARVEEQRLNHILGTAPPPNSQVKAAQEPTKYPGTRTLEFKVLDRENNILQLDGRSSWQNTGVRVSAGDVVIISADPTSSVCSSDAPCVGPSGQQGHAKFTRVDPDQFPCQNAQFQALIGRFGPSGAPFEIGLHVIQPVPSGIKDDELQVMSNIRLPYLNLVTGGHRILSIELKGFGQ